MEYKCSICGEVFDSISELINHLSGHQEEEDQKYYMSEDLDVIKQIISDVEKEIDEFNEKYSNLMNITYNFNFVEHGKRKTIPKEASNKTCEESTKDKNNAKEADEFIKTLDEFINELNIKDKLEKTKKKPEMSFIEFLDTIFE